MEIRHGMVVAQDGDGLSRVKALVGPIPCPSGTIANEHLRGLGDAIGRPRGMFHLPNESVLVMSLGQRNSGLVMPIEEEK